MPGACRAVAPSVHSRSLLGGRAHVPHGACGAAGDHTWSLPSIESSSVLPLIAPAIILASTMTRLCFVSQ